MFFWHSKALLNSNISVILLLLLQWVYCNVNSLTRDIVVCMGPVVWNAAVPVLSGWAGAVDSQFIIRQLKRWHAFEQQVFIASNAIVHTYVYDRKDAKSGSLTDIPNTTMKFWPADDNSREFFTVAAVIGLGRSLMVWVRFKQSTGMAGQYTELTWTLIKRPSLACSVQISWMRRW